MLVSLLVGGLLGCGTSWYFARKSGQELRDEARNLAQLSELILHALEMRAWPRFEEVLSVVDPSA